MAGTGYQQGIGLVMVVEKLTGARGEGRAVCRDLFGGVLG